MIRCHPLLRWILTLNLRILLKHKELWREGYIIGIFEVTVMVGFLMERYASISISRFVMDVLLV